MKLARRQFLHLAAGAVAFPAASRTARAQDVSSGRPQRNRYTKRQSPTGTNDKMWRGLEGKLLKIGRLVELVLRATAHCDSGQNARIVN